MQESVYYRKTQLEHGTEALGGQLWYCVVPVRYGTFNKVLTPPMRPVLLSRTMKRTR